MSPSIASSFHRVYLPGSFGPDETKAKILINTSLVASLLYNVMTSLLNKSPDWIPTYHKAARTFIQTPNLSLIAGSFKSAYSLSEGPAHFGELEF